MAPGAAASGPGERFCGRGSGTPQPGGRRDVLPADADAGDYLRTAAL